MATIVTLETGPTAKNSPLTVMEIDNNWININDEVVAMDGVVTNLTNNTYTKTETDSSAMALAIALG